MEIILMTLPGRDVLSALVDPRRRHASEIKQPCENHDIRSFPRYNDNARERGRIYML